MEVVNTVTAIFLVAIVVIVIGSIIIQGITKR